MTGSQIRQMVRDKFPNEMISEHDFRGDDTVVMDRRVSHEVLQFLRDEPSLSFNQLVDICGVDYLEREPRFEVVYHLKSIPHNQRIRLRVPIPEEDLVVDSVVDLWVGANWFEREAFDMYGIKFLNHPNLRRILTHESFMGNPLRKDYPINKRPKLLTPTEDILTPKPFKG